MNDKEVKVYSYRWVVLFIFSLVGAAIQLQWLTFAPIARVAASVYGFGADQMLYIDLLSIIFMGVYVLVAIPASYVIDTYGIKIGVGIGAVLMAAFGLLKGFFADSYTIMLVAQVGLAVAQPFIINAATKIGARWFPLKERASAVGITTLAQFLGIIIVMMVTPEVIGLDKQGNYLNDGSMQNIMLIYGIITAAIAFIFLIFVREKPPTAPGVDEESRIRVIEGLKHMLANHSTRMIIILFFIGLGIFNAISTVIDQVMKIRGLNVEDTGLVGGVMLIAGIIGAVVIPPFSDKFKKRKLFIIIAMVGMTPGVIGLTIFTDTTLLIASSAILGFFLLGIGAPIGFQYTAEISAPAPESTSQGLILLAGQISGILFIVAMNIIGMLEIMAVLSGLAAVTAIIALLLKESPAMNSNSASS